MDNLQIFKNEEFGQVRVMLINNEPYFVGKDVAEILGYADSSSAVSKNVDSDDKTTLLLQQDGSNYKSKTTIINESGLYSLILSSKLPTAKKFKKWVTSEVLPSIRKHGAYMTNETLEEALTSPDFLIKLATELKKEKEQRQALEKEQKKNAPKVLFADAVSGSNTSILIGDFAKILKQNGVKTGQNKLFSWLRENNYLIKRRGQSYNMPTQKSMDLGLFEIKENTITKSDGDTIITMTAKITGKGQTYFMNKFIKKM